MDACSHQKCEFEPESGILLRDTSVCGQQIKGSSIALDDNRLNRNLITLQRNYGRPTRELSQWLVMDRQPTNADTNNRCQLTKQTVTHRNRKLSDCGAHMLDRPIHLVTGDNVSRDHVLQLYVSGISVPNNGSEEDQIHIQRTTE